MQFLKLVFLLMAFTGTIGHLFGQDDLPIKNFKRVTALSTPKFDSTSYIRMDKSTSIIYRFFFNQTGRKNEGMPRLKREEELDWVVEDIITTSIVDQNGKAIELGENITPVFVFEGRAICYKRDRVNGTTLLLSYSVNNGRIEDSLSFFSPFIEVDNIDDKWLVLTEDFEICQNLLFFDKELKHKITLTPFKDRSGFENYFYNVEIDGTINLCMLSADKHIKKYNIDNSISKFKEYSITPTDVEYNSGIVFQAAPSSNGVLIYFVSSDNRKVLSKFDIEGKVQWKKYVMLPGGVYKNRGFVENLNNGLIGAFVKNNNEYFIKIYNSNSGNEVSSFACNNYPTLSLNIRGVLPGWMKWTSDQILLFEIDVIQKAGLIEARDIFYFNKKKESLNKLQPPEKDIINSSFIFVEEDSLIKYISLNRIFSYEKD